MSTNARKQAKIVIRMTRRAECFILFSKSNTNAEKSSKIHFGSSILSSRLETSVFDLNRAVSEGHFVKSSVKALKLLLFLMVETRGGKSSFVQSDNLQTVDARVTDEERGGVKERSTCSSGAAEKLIEQAKNAAKDRQKKLTETRQMHIPKSGSQSDSALSPETQAKLLLEQKVDDSRLQQKTVKGLTVKALEPQTGTPPRVPADTNGPQLEPRNLDSEMFFEEEEDIKTLMKEMMKKMVTKDDLAGLATKRDLEVLKQEVKEEVKEQVKEEVVKAVALVRAEVQEVKDRVRKLEKGKGSGKSSEDFAFKRVEFKGFKKETSPTARLEAMKQFCSRYSGPTAAAFGNNCTGDYKNRMLRDSSFAEFADADAVREFLNTAEETTQVEGASVTVKKATPLFFRQRNWALYTAKDLLQNADKGSKVEIHKNGARRTVTVNSVEAFVQEREDTRGTFAGSFAHFSLPR